MRRETEFGFVYGGPPWAIEDESGNCWDYVLILEDGTSQTLWQPDISIGRDPSCFITIQSSIVSRTHAHLHYASGQWYLEDDHSTNGTALNGQCLTAKQRRALQSGDRITLSGKITLVFQKNPDGSANGSGYPFTHSFRTTTLW